MRDLLQEPEAAAQNAVCVLRSHNRVVGYEEQRPLHKVRGPPEFPPKEELGGAAPTP